MLYSMIHHNNLGDPLDKRIKDGFEVTTSQVYPPKKTVEKCMRHDVDRKALGRSHIAEVFLVFLRLGLTSFGGPVAHLGYFHQEFVARRKWLDDRAYADLVALCQFLPGPASSQVGLAVGLSRAGFGGALAAWTGFTLPSALALVLFAFGMSALGSTAESPWLHGLKIAAVAVVAQAVLAMTRALAPDKERATLAVVAACMVLLFPSAWSQVAAIVMGAIVGVMLLKVETTPEAPAAIPLAIGRRTALLSLFLFFALLIGLPILAAQSSDMNVKLMDSFYRSGSLVFGGGHVVLPLLQAEVVPPGWVNDSQFMAGYGAAQAVPGPLFTFAAYLGAVIGGWSAAAISLLAVFLPSFLLVIGALPFWETLRTRSWAQSLLRGINATVVGLLVAAFYDPVWTTGITSARDFALAMVAFLALQMWKVAPWLVVILCAFAASGLAVLLPA